MTMTNPPTDEIERVARAMKGGASICSSTLGLIYGQLSDYDWNWLANSALRAMDTRRENEVLHKAVAAFADALDVADDIIAVNCGTDTPREWDRAFRRAQIARAALTKPVGDGHAG